mmetsp:Transcript_57489/g.136742  ORF Transcript_57489/g.136742 Transcript_57489/m.136742 type:complete len:289 (-) Transcript_57489:19-885(-)
MSTKLYERWLASVGGPFFTTLFTAFVTTVYLLVLYRATSVWAIVLKIVAVVCAVGVAVGAWLCWVVDPGAPERDESDPGPGEQWTEEERMRIRYTPSGREWEQKWCRTCKLWRPHRCGHCRICQRCVRRLDHHCFWVGTCVGERNLRFFAMMVLFGGLGLLCISIIGIGHLIADHKTVEIWEWVLIPLLLLFACPCVVPGPLPMSVIMLITGIFYVLVMISDAEMRKLSQDFESELRHIQEEGICRGFCPYFCGPLKCNPHGCWPLEELPEEDEELSDLNQPLEMTAS